MSIRRIFLDWRTGALPQAAAYLLHESVPAAGDGASLDGSLDLGGVIVAVPGARAGRRLEELLVEQAQSLGRPIVPPRMVTVGRLPELLYTPQRPFANELQQQLAWAEALGGLDRATLEPLVPHPPEDDDARAWLDLGRLVQEQHRELAAEQLDFAAVIRATEELGQPRETARWRVLAELQRRYLARLDELGLWDRQTARLVAIERRECRTDRQIVLVAMVDVDRQARAMLDQVAEQVTSLVFAPESLEDRFDEHGCLVSDPWRGAAIELDDEAIVVVDSAADQADAVVRAIAGLEGRYAAEEITVGLPDQSLLPHVAQRLTEAELPARWGVGQSISQTRPSRMLEAVGEFLQSGRFRDAATLVRHVDVEDWIERHLKACNVRLPRPDWIALVDEYHAERLPVWFQPPRTENQRTGSSDDQIERGTRPRIPAGAGAPGFGAPDGSASVDDIGEEMNGVAEPSKTQTARRAMQAIAGALAALVGRFGGAERRLDQWNEPIVELLVEVYGGSPLDENDPAQRTTLEVLKSIRAALEQFAALGEELMPTVSAGEAIALVLEQLADQNIAPQADRAAIEMLGWLELPLDDAPALVVSGMNEGRVPGSLNSDLFLPNALRKHLGLVDNDRRWARDAYATSLLVASRRDLTLIAGRRDDEGDPLAPSRLLLACQREQLPQRTLRFFRPSASGAAPLRLTGSLAAGSARYSVAIPPARPLSPPIESLSVTSFRDYLACPYRWWLKHALRLEELGDAVEELDPASFGSLAHDVLRDFGESELRHSTVAQQIADWLRARLDELARWRFGRAPLPAVQVQIEQLARRLAAFAHWQANWAEAGWEIRHVERNFARGEATFDVDGVPFGLHGRIDRIDVHRHSGQWMVFDYKTSESPTDPIKAHYRKEAWVDLQLPLYRHLVRTLDVAEAPVELGYIVLPKSLADVGMLKAEWRPDELEAADEAAREVVRGIRAGRFEINPEYDSPFDGFSAICQADVLGAVGEPDLLESSGEESA